VYYSSLPPEVAAQRLRSAEIGDAPNP